jgi:prefoldin subunit 5
MNEDQIEAFSNVRDALHAGIGALIMARRRIDEAAEILKKADERYIKMAHELQYAAKNLGTMRDYFDAIEMQVPLFIKKES